MVRAGFKTLVACFSLGGIEGAKILGNMGFEPQGENLSLIMVEAGKKKNAGRYIIEARMDELKPSGEKYYMGIPGFACYRRLHHCHAHSTTHTTTNNHSFQPIPC